MVDDEKLTREGIRDSLGLESLGISQVLLEDDGIHGLKTALEAVSYTHLSGPDPPEPFSAVPPPHRTDQSPSAPLLESGAFSWPGVPPSD